MSASRRAGARLAAALATAVLALTMASCAFGQNQPDTPATGGNGAPAGVVNYRVSHPEWLTNAHKKGHLTYPTSPPVGGDHNPYWQNCVGDIYPAQIANEHAVHSMEHGAVWVTYRPGLPAAQVAALAARVRDRPYLLMSPYPGLDRPISLQAWGYQLKVDSADDPAIDQFIRAYRIRAAPEPGATCANGITDTGVNADLNL